MIKFWFFLVFLVPGLLLSQPTFPYNGVMPKEVTSVVLENATIYVDYKTIVENATLVVENGRVTAVGKNVAIPDNAVRYDATGKFIYPSFIDLYSDYGIPAPAAKETAGNQAGGEKGAFGWNPAIKSDWNSAVAFVPKEESAKSFVVLVLELCCRIAWMVSFVVLPRLLLLGTMPTWP